MLPFSAVSGWELVAGAAVGVDLALASRILGIAVARARLLGIRLWVKRLAKAQ